jgi:TolB-like protein/Tfp pilus assembly protein PilF
MGLDEEGTLSRLKACRATLVDPQIAEHRGRIVKTTGDGMLVEFASAVDAARCAVEVQRTMAGLNSDVAREIRIEFRIGIHVGDIITDENDIFGDGVNIAARLEGIAEVGGVCISDDAYRQIRGKVDIGFNDIGPQYLKNIAEPMRAWGIRIDANSSSPPKATAETPQLLPLPQKPSIAILPFDNMSADPEQEYFADGIVEDMITELSRFRSLFVIARNSSFTYKGKAVDIKQVGRDLGVRYVLEGSVRKAGGKVRITGQLIDSSNGSHLWADKFDGPLDDIFALQDQVTTSVVGAIFPRMEQAEIERSTRKPTGSLDAYDYFLRGMAGIHEGTKDSSAAALRSLYKAIDIDPGYASAYGLAALCYVRRKSNAWMVKVDEEVEETERLSRIAAALGKDDAAALCASGYALALVNGAVKEGSDLIDRALSLNPNLAWAWLFSGWVQVWLGHSQIAIEQIARAMRLSPQDPQRFNMQAGMACAHFFVGRYGEALSYAERALSDRPNHLPSISLIVAANALAGRDAEAEKARARLHKLDSEFRISRLTETLPLLQPDDLGKWVEGMRKGGVPD